jgi:hypothetical protein
VSLQASAKQPTIGKLIDDTMTSIEKDNPTASPTSQLTQCPVLSRGRESSGERTGQVRSPESAAGGNGELSANGDAPQVVAVQVENDERRKLSLSAPCVNPSVSGMPFNGMP